MQKANHAATLDFTMKSEATDELAFLQCEEIIHVMWLHAANKTKLCICNQDRNVTEELAFLQRRQSHPCLVNARVNQDRNAIVELTFLLHGQSHPCLVNACGQQAHMPPPRTVPPVSVGECPTHHASSTCHHTASARPAVGVLLPQRGNCITHNSCNTLCIFSLSSYCRNH